MQNGSQEPLVVLTITAKPGGSLKKSERSSYGKL
jgi:hypothetical protein